MGKPLMRENSFNVTYGVARVIESGVFIRHSVLLVAVNYLMLFISIYSHFI